MSSELKEKNIRPIVAWDDQKTIYFIYRDEEKKKQVFKVENFQWYFCVLTSQYESREGFSAIEDSAKKAMTKWVIRRNENGNIFKDKDGRNLYDKIERLNPVKKVKKVKNFVKIYCDKTDETKDFLKYLEEKQIETREADLNLVKRYMIDNLVEIEEDLSILFFDIETNDENQGIVIGRDEIISWAACDNSGKTFFEISEDIDYGESDLIIKLLKLFQEYDLIVGWNSKQFDLSYIQERINLLGITGKEFGEEDINVNQTNFWKNIIHIDLMQRLIKLFGPMMSVVNLTGFSLNEVAKVFIGEQKLERPEKVIDLFNKNKKKLKEYNLKDVLLVKQINDRLRTLPLMIKECAWTGTFMDRFYIGELLDYYILREANQQDYHLKTRPKYNENPESIRIRGGFVMEPKTGLYDNVRTLDFRCFARGTKINTDSGIKNIEELKLTDKIQNIHNKFAEVKALSKQKFVGYLKEIKTTNENIILCTPNHKWPVRMKDKFVLKEAKNLTLKDSLLVSEKICFNENKDDNDLFELLGIFYFESTVKKIKHRTKKNYISDDYRISLRLLKSEIDFKNRISELITKHTDFSFEWRLERNSYSLKIGNLLKNGKKNSKEVYLWFTEKYKLLNNNIFLNSSHNIKYFIKGAFEADGTINRARDTIVINSGTKYKLDKKDRILFLHDLLKRVSIFSNVGSFKSKKILEIRRNKDIAKFQNDINFISKIKRLRLDEIIKTNKRKNNISLKGFEKRDILSIRDVFYDDLVYNIGMKNQQEPYYISNGLLTKNSMYPSIIVGWNIGQESLISGELSEKAQRGFSNWIKERKIEEVPFIEWFEFLKDENKKLNPGNKYFQTANNQFFTREKPSIIAGLVKRLLEERKAYKAQQLAAEYNSIEYKNSQASQEAVKEMSNSMFGITADKQARFFDPRIAEAITMTGQFLNRTAIAIFEKMGYPVIYADTDSVFTIVDDDEEMSKAIKELNKKLSEHLVKTYRFKDNIISVEYEKKFRKFIMLDKKRYAGHLVEIDAKKVDSVLSKGTENVRKSTIDFTKNKVNECLDLLVKKDKDVDFMCKWVENLREFVLSERLREDMLKVGGQPLAITMKLSKPTTAYKTETPHVRLAKQMVADKEILETREGKHVWGQKIEYYIRDAYIKGLRDSESSRAQKAQNAALIRDYVKNSGDHDKKYYWDVQIFAPLMRILSVVWKSVDWKKYTVSYQEKEAKEAAKKIKKEQMIFEKIKIKQEKEEKNKKREKKKNKIIKSKQQKLF